MRMMKNNDNETVMVIGIDHGYGNMKTATRCFPSGVARYDKEPIFQNSGLCNGSVKGTGKLYQQRKVYRKNEAVRVERKLDRETEAHHIPESGWKESA